MMLKDNMKNGLLYVEHGHDNQDDLQYEQLLETQRKLCKERIYDYNLLRPSDMTSKYALLKELLGSCGEKIYLEAPIHFAYGCNTYIGENFYANFNLTIVDDIEVYIGNHVMMGPNVTLSVTGHPLDFHYRNDGTQFSLPIRIGNNVWLGANVVVLPGVSIGDNSVIGAGSVVTKDIPDNVLAYGLPCKVIRKISDYDKEYFRKDKKVNFDW